MALSSMSANDGLTAAEAASEQTPLLANTGSFDFGGKVSSIGGNGTGSSTVLDPSSDALTTREKVYLILEGRYGKVGQIYEGVTIFLIITSIAAFVFGSLFDTDYNGDAPYVDMCGKVCDAIFFGNDPDNGEYVLQDLSKLIATY